MCAFGVCPVCDVKAEHSSYRVRTDPVWDILPVCRHFYRSPCAPGDFVLQLTLRAIDRNFKYSLCIFKKPKSRISGIPAIEITCQKQGIQLRGVLRGQISKAKSNLSEKTWAETEN